MGYFSESMEELSYWQNRCRLAEKFIEESPCDPDIHEDQIEAYNQWQEVKNNPYRLEI